MFKPLFEIKSCVEVTWQFLLWKSHYYHGKVVAVIRNSSELRITASISHAEVLVDHLCILNKRIGIQINFIRKTPYLKNNIFILSVNSNC